MLEDAAKDGVTAAAKKHGISRFSIYDWRASRLSLRAVAARLTAEGHLSRAGRQFLAQQVSRMVSQSARGASRRRRRASLH